MAPTDKILKIWDETFQHREPCKKLSYFFTKYKCVSSPVGYILFTNDFNRLHANAANALISAWNETSALILNEVNKKRKNYPSDEVLINAGKNL